MTAESTSDAQERDALLSANSFLEGVADTALNQRDVARADLTNTRAAFDLAEELRLKAVAELASARTELEQLRAAAVRVVTITPLAPPPPISVLERWLCMTCGYQHGSPCDYHKHGELVPVVITVTYKDLGAPPHA